MLSKQSENVRDFQACPWINLICSIYAMAADDCLIPLTELPPGLWNRNQSNFGQMELEPEQARNHRAVPPQIFFVLPGNLC